MIKFDKTIKALKEYQKQADLYDPHDPKLSFFQHSEKTTELERLGSIVAEAFTKEGIDQDFIQPGEWLEFILSEGKK